MGDSTTQPLLGVSVQPNEEGGSSSQVAQEVETKFQQSLYTHPREAIKWLERNGVKKLGTFRVKVQHPMQLCIADQSRSGRSHCES